MTDETTTTQPQEQNLTDSPHYLAQALMANGIKNMYGIVGIPVTDFARIAQGMGMRYIGMRHEERPATSSTCTKANMRVSTR